MTGRRTFRISFRPAARLNWLQRAAGLALVLVLAVLGFFFITVALAAGAILAAAVLLRLWWLKRKLRKTAGTATYEGDYVVIEHVANVPDAPNVPDVSNDPQAPGTPGGRGKPDAG